MNAETRRNEGGPVLAREFPEATELGRFLVERKMTIGVAESCTGGLMGAALTALPGSSAYFVGGIVAYSNHLKTQLLGVEADLIAEHGAVSEPVAAAMARGCRIRLGVDVAIAVTGVAGPVDEHSDKRAGHIYIAVAVGDALSVELVKGDRGRESNRAGAVRAAIQLCADALTW